MSCPISLIGTWCGVTRPIDVYRVLEAREPWHRLAVVAPQALTPLVGRKRDIGLLLDRWEQAQVGLGQVVVLVGEAGIGKSRLVAVLQDHIAGAAVAQVVCRGSAFHQHSAWYPLTEFFHRALHWQRHDTADAKLQKLIAALERYGLTVPEMVPVFAALLSLPLPPHRYPPLPLSPQRLRHQTFDALLTWLAALAAHGPVLFIVEDLHYVDPSTLEWLDLLLVQGPTARLLTLLTCRPAFQPPWRLQAHVSLLTLGRLSPTQTAQMVMGVAGGKTLPPDVLQQVVTKSDEVPLFIEELTKMVLESALLQEHEAYYALTAPLPALVIPSTLQASLMARLDRLSTAKGVVQLGATLGWVFAYEVLQAVSPLDEISLQHELARLVVAELLCQRVVPPQATTPSSMSSSRRSPISRCSRVRGSSTITTFHRYWLPTFRRRWRPSQNCWRITAPRRDSVLRPWGIGSGPASMPSSAGPTRKRSNTSLQL